MKREDTLKLARAAGAINLHERPKEFALVGNGVIERFSELVAAAERETIAAKLIELGVLGEGEFINAIRSRGNK